MTGISGDSYFADMHVHLGRAGNNQPVKITASKNLTLANILNYCHQRKGIDIVGVVDSGSPAAWMDIEGLIKEGDLVELADGGLRFQDKVTLILGLEIELRDKKNEPSHWLAYFPNLLQIKSFCSLLHNYIKNPILSSQRAYLTSGDFCQEVNNYQGIYLPAHAFTPHKSVYGKVTDSLRNFLGQTNFDNLLALELGLSADTLMAGKLTELKKVAFLSNSDAHSLEKIGREYNQLKLAAPTYAEFLMALQGLEGREILANYGLNPRLGKYYRTFCNECSSILDQDTVVKICPICNSSNITIGVSQRIEEIGDSTASNLAARPPYYYQIPLQFIPGIGPKTITKLINYFKSEIIVLNYAGKEELLEVVHKDIAEKILAARINKLRLGAGGGGKYGKVLGETSMEEADNLDY